MLFVGNDWAEDHVRHEASEGVCCISGMQTYLTAWTPYSDSKGEFSKGRRKPMPRVDIHTELVVAAAEILDESVPCADHSR